LRSIALAKFPKNLWCADIYIQEFISAEDSRRLQLWPSFVKIFCLVCWR